MRGVATRPIAAGDEIFNSFGVGTPEIFRDYGFVEPQPQQWWFLSGGEKWTFWLREDEVVFPEKLALPRFARATEAWLRDPPPVGMVGTPQQRRVHDFHTAFIDAVRAALAAARAARGPGSWILRSHAAALGDL